LHIVDDLESIAARLGGDAKAVARGCTARVAQWLTEHPAVADEALAVLREIRPILLTHGFALVTRFDDVCEVLEHPLQFTVTKYTEKMRPLAGDFILGLDATPQYDHDVSVLRLAIPRDDVPAVGAMAAERARALVDAARPSGRIDVVRDLCDRVPAAVVAEYLGVPGPDERTLIAWSRILFWEIFANVQDDAEVASQAATAGREFGRYLDEVIATRRAELAGDGRSSGRDDVLTRLLRMQACPSSSFDDAEIRTNLFGLIVGLIPTTSKATALAIDALLRRPPALAGAQQAAASGDDGVLSAHVFEAMRLCPQAPGLFRVCATDYVLAEGTSREVLIPEGTVVLASTQSAMMDGKVLEHPGEFRLGRPAWRQLHFGIGPHTCFGQYINRVQIPAIVAALLRAGPVRPATGDAGTIRFGGPFPASMTVEFAAP
jgi:cytochrome P450